MAFVAAVLAIVSGVFAFVELRGGGSAGGDDDVVRFTAAARNKTGEVVSCGTMQFLKVGAPLATTGVLDIHEGVWDPPGEAAAAAAATRVAVKVASSKRQAHRLAEEVRWLRELRGDPGVVPLLGACAGRKHAEAVTRLPDIFILTPADVTAACVGRGEDTEAACARSLALSALTLFSAFAEERPLVHPAMERERSGTGSAILLAVSQSAGAAASELLLFDLDGVEALRTPEPARMAPFVAGNVLAPLAELAPELGVAAESLRTAAQAAQLAPRAPFACVRAWLRSDLYTRAPAPTPCPE